MKILITTFILLIYLIIGVLIVNLICATILKHESVKDEELLLGVFVVLWPTLFFVLIIYFIGNFTRNIIYKIRRMDS